MPRETVGRTFLVAFSVCVVFSVLVSAAAVSLRPTQAVNKLLDKKKNILMAAGLLEEGGSIDEAFAAIRAKVVELETGAYVDMDPDEYDQRKAAKDPTLSVDIDRAVDSGGIKRRARFAPIYLVYKDDAVDKIIMPVHGKGLWSTLYGFVALDIDDLNTIKGLVFYEHGETPGLGGEVDNPNWKALWPGKKAFDESGRVAIEVTRVPVAAGRPGAEHKVDGLSGATITSRGVQGLLRYWLGPEGFGPYLNKLKEKA